MLLENGLAYFSNTNTFVVRIRLRCEDFIFGVFWNIKTLHLLIFAILIHSDKIVVSPSVIFSVLASFISNIVNMKSNFVGWCNSGLWRSEDCRWEAFSVWWWHTVEYYKSTWSKCLQRDNEQRKRFWGMFDFYIKWMNRRFLNTVVFISI